MESVSASYGLALFELASEEQALEAYKKDLDFIQSSLDQEALRFLNQSMIDRNQRKAVVDQCFKGNISNNVLNFLKLLIDRQRMNYLFDISNVYKDYYNEALGIEEGKLYTVELLDDKTIAEIEASLSKKEGKKVVLTQVLDASMIGGLKAVIKDHVYDHSIQNQMIQLRKQLVKGSR